MGQDDAHAGRGEGEERIHEDILDAPAKEGNVSLVVQDG